MHVVEVITADSAWIATYCRREMGPLHHHQHHTIVVSGDSSWFNGASSRHVPRMQKDNMIACCHCDVVGINIRDLACEVNARAKPHLINGKRGIELVPWCCAWVDMCPWNFLTNCGCCYHVKILSAPKQALHSNFNFLLFFGCRMSSLNSLTDATHFHWEKTTNTNSLKKCGISWLNVASMEETSNLVNLGMNWGSICLHCPLFICGWQGVSS